MLVFIVKTVVFIFPVILGTAFITKEVARFRDICSRANIIIAPDIEAD